MRYKRPYTEGRMLIEPLGIRVVFAVWNRSGAKLCQHKWRFFRVRSVGLSIPYAFCNRANRLVTGPPQWEENA